MADAREPYVSAEWVIPLGIYLDQDSSKLLIEDVTADMLEDVAVLAAEFVSANIGHVVETTLVDDLTDYGRLMDMVVLYTSTDGIKRSSSSILASAFDGFNFIAPTVAITRGCGHPDLDPDLAEHGNG